MKHSLIYLNYDPENRKPWVGTALRSVLSTLTGDDFELLIVKDTEGYVNAVNKGISLARGDFFHVINDDVIMMEHDWAEKLAQPGVITSWRFNEFFITKEKLPDGALYCIPRTVFEKLGPLDDRYAKGYGCDEIDYWFTAKLNGVPMLEKQINLKHLENKTYQTYFKDLKENMTGRNHQLFCEKWRDQLPPPHGSKL